jgi:hypothetical protein
MEVQDNARVRMDRDASGLDLTYELVPFHEPRGDAAAKHFS